MEASLTSDKILSWSIIFVDLLFDITEGRKVAHEIDKHQHEMACMSTKFDWRSNKRNTSSTLNGIYGSTNSKLLATEFSFSYPMTNWTRKKKGKCIQY